MYNNQGYPPNGPMPTLNNMITAPGGYNNNYPPQQGYNNYNNQNYPPQGGYPPQGNYGPPQGNYGPPQGNYGPPQGNYGPPQGNYGPQGGYPNPNIPPSGPVQAMPIIPQGNMPYGPTNTLSGGLVYNCDGFCQQIHNAVHGAGTDEQTIINIICSTTAEQRAEIRKRYVALFGKD